MSSSSKYTYAQIQEASAAIVAETDPEYPFTWEEIEAKIKELEAAPEWVPFPYYLHDGKSSSERIEMISERTGISESSPIWEELGRPFYEVTLECEISRKTGEVRILGVKS